MSASETHRSLKTLLRNAAAISLFAVPVIIPSILRAQAIDINSSGTYTQNFNTLANTGTGVAWANNSTLSGWYVQSTSATPTTYQADTGAVSSASLISYGSASSSDRALGNITTNAVGAWAYGVQLKNNTAGSVNLGNIGYTLEQWRSGSGASLNSVSFWYQISNSAITSVNPLAASAGVTDSAPSAAWIAVSALNAGSKINTGVAASLDGNLDANKTAVSTSLSTVTLTAGQYIMFRWSDINHANNDSGLGIDDFTVSYSSATITGNYWNGSSGAWSSSSTNWATATAGGGTTGVTQAASGALIFDTASAAVTVNDTVTVNAGLTFGANGITITPGTGTPIISLAGASAATNAITVTNVGDTASVSVKLTGSNGLTKSGNGKLTLSGDNSGLSGVVTLSAGTLRASSANALGAGTLSIAGGTLELASNNGVSFNCNTTVSADATIKSDRAANDNGAGATQTLGTLSIGGQTLTIDRGGNVGSGNTGITFGAVTLSGAPTFTVNASSLLTLASVTGATQNIIINGAGDTTVSGAIATTSGSLTKSGNGILTLNGANTFTGGLTINAGTVSLGNTGALNENTVAFGSGSTGTLSLNGNNATIAGLNTNATAGITYVQNGSASTNATLTIGNSTTANSTFAGVIQNGSTGTLALNKSGTGTLTLTSAHTYTGGTNINQGKIVLNGGSLAAGTVSIASGATLATSGVASAGSLSLVTGATVDLTSAGLSLTGALTATGGDLNYTLGNTLAVTGALTLSGTVNITLAGNFEAKTYELLTFATTDVSILNALTVTTTKLGWKVTPVITGTKYSIDIAIASSSLNWNLSSGDFWDTTTSTNWYNNSLTTTQAFANGDNVTFAQSSGGIITIDTSVSPASTTVNSSGDYTFQTGTLAGDGGITKSGVGKLNLLSANTFLGEVVVNAGTLVVGNVTALGAITTGTRILSGATLEISSDITLAAEPLTLVGTGVAGVGALTSQPGVHTVSGPITLGGDTLITSQGSAGADTFTITGTISGSNSTLTIGGSASTAISGNISGTGLALNKTGNGILTLSGSGNTYGGLTSVNAGTLVAQSATSISPTVSVSNGATLSLQDNQTLTSLTGSGQVSVADGKTFTLNNTTTQNFGGTFTGTSGTAFIKSGSGTLNLSGASTSLARDFTLSAGTVKASNNNALGAGTVLIGTGGSGTTGTLYVANDKTISNNITVGSSVKGTNSLLAGWDFQTTTNGGTAAAVAPSSPNVFVANFGSGTLYLNGTNGASNWITATAGNEVTSFGGNAGTGSFSTSTTGASSLSLVGGTSNSANSKYMVFAINMLGKNGLTISYDTRGTSTGFKNQIWEYSTDGVNWTSAATITPISTTAYETKSLSEITALNGDSTSFVRLSLTGAASATGNNRLDNITFLALGADSTTGSGILGIDEAGIATFTGNVVVNNTAELTAATGGTAIFQTGVISGLGSLTKTGNGTVELQGANTFTGSLTLSAGNLKVSTLGAGGAASPLGAGADVPGSIIFTGGKLEYAGSGETLTRDFTVGNGGAGFIASGTGALNIGQDAQMDFDNTAASNRTLTLGGTTDIAVENIFNPKKFDAGDINNFFTKLVKQDTNKWIVKGAGAGFVDNASTEMNIDGGELDFTTGALGSSAHTAHINVGSATLGWYAGNTDDLSGRIYLNNNAAAAVFDVPSGTVTFASALNGDAVTNASLTKLGAGTLALSVENKFSGNFNISAGTVNATNAKSLGTGNVIVGPGNKTSPSATLLLSLNPTAVIANKINVISGGTLAGTGTDDDATIEDGGILSPNADSIGTLSFNKLTLNGGAHVKWQLQNVALGAGVGYDTLVVATLNLNNAISTKKKIVVEVTSSGPATGFEKMKANKFEFANITIDLASGVNVTDLFFIDALQFETDNNLTNDHLVWSMQYAADRDMMYVTTMIPEPSTYGLGLSALALAAVAIRRRKKKKI